MKELIFAVSGAMLTVVAAVVGRIVSRSRTDFWVVRGDQSVVEVEVGVSNVLFEVGFS